MITIDASRLTVSVDGEKFYFGHTKEYAILTMLVKANGVPVNRQQVAREIKSKDSSARAIDQYISRIRKLIGKDKIRTIRNVGYALYC